MKFDLSKPCGNCPFRSDKFFPLHEDRVKQIVYNASDFQCHKTVDYSDEKPSQGDKPQHCAGLSIMLEKMDRPNQTMRIAERFGAYDRDKLDMDSPVYGDIEEYLEQIALQV